MRHRGLVGLLAAALLIAAVPALAQTEGPRATVLDEPATWRERAALLMDHGSLGPALRAHGYYFAGGDEIYLAEIVPGVGQPAMVMYDAVEGAFSLRFWPASSVKALVSVAALEYLGSQGFAGDDRLSASWLGERTLQSIYRPAIVNSDNRSYDLLVRVAGVDFINLDFAPRHGLDSVVVGSNFSGLGVLSSPGYTATREVLPEELPPVRRWSGEPITLVRDIPGRNASRHYGDNDADLFDLGEVIRRVMLHDEIPAAHRFDLEAGDLEALEEALCDAEPAHYESGARRVLGDDAEVCGKSGWWDRTPSEEEAAAGADQEGGEGGDASEGGEGGEGGEEEPVVLPPGCTDVALITDPDTGRRFLLAATGGCGGGGLSALAGPALEAAAELDGPPLQLDAGVPMEVGVSAAGDTLEVEIAGQVGWVLVRVDGGDPVVAARRGGPLRAEFPLPAAGRHLLIIQAIDFGVPVGYRAVDFEVSGA